MSYTRRYRETVSKTATFTGTFSYPASQSGGVKSVSLTDTVHIPVDVNIHVDTVSFDHSVQDCGEHVNVLTGAVVATETAAIISKDLNSKKVADSIISGFFSYVKSEISQQIAEITQNTDSLLMHLRELSKACLAKKTQMESDYHRISSRYMKIFGDLNQELNNRIFQLDKPTFSFKKEIDQQNIRLLDGGIVGIVSVFGAESGDLQVKVAGSLAKKRAYDTIGKAQAYIRQQKRLNDRIGHSTINDDRAGQLFAPVCFVQLYNDSRQIDNYLYAPEPLKLLESAYQRDTLTQQLLSGQTTWQTISPESEKLLSFFFNQELHKHATATSQSPRVLQMIRNICCLNQIKVNY